jgi:Ni,Fe-hydrogenase III large subunit/Ni,Fe-hydrogenase III component G
MKREVIKVDRHELPEAFKLYFKQKVRLMTMVASDEKELGVDRFVLRYVFSKDQLQISILETVIPESDPTFASLTQILPAASWYEREAHDLFGIQPLGHPDLRRLVLHEDFPQGVYPLRKDYPLQLKQPRVDDTPFSFPEVKGAGVFQVPVGPIHAGVIEPGHFRFQVMGDSVLHLEARLFYTHRGIEKRSEGMSLAKGLFLAERICGVCNVSHTISYAQAIEQIAGVKIPLRAKYIRTLINEMERLYNHVGDIGNICAGVGFAFGSNHSSRLKETLMQLNERMTGHRYLRGIITLGGVNRDLPSEQLDEIWQVVQEVESNIQEITNDILSNDIVVNRYRKTGILPTDVAEQFGTVGPAARSSNITADSRREHPYAAYPYLHFEIPTLEGGDVLARFRMRSLEIHQSVEIIRQVISQIPNGALRIQISHVPPYRFGIGISESPRGENIHFIMTGENNTIYRFRIRSASYANWIIVPSCAADNIIADFPLINKSFELCYACCDR